MDHDNDNQGAQATSCLHSIELCFPTHTWHRKISSRPCPCSTASHPTSLTGPNSTQNISTYLHSLGPFSRRHSTADTPSTSPQCILYYPAFLTKCIYSPLQERNTRWKSHRTLQTLLEGSYTSTTSFQLHADSQTGFQTRSSLSDTDELLY